MLVVTKLSKSINVMFVIHLHLPLHRATKCEWFDSLDNFRVVLYKAEYSEPDIRNVLKIPGKQLSLINW